MRIAVVSDLHTDHAENQEALVQLAVAIHEGEADVIVVAGDVSPRADRVHRALKALLQVCPAVVFVPGNHDLWFDTRDAASDPNADAWRRYRVELKALCDLVGAHYLPARPYRRGALALAGTCGWSDHSFLLPKIRAEIDPADLAAKRFGGAQWSDARFVVFRGDAGEPMSDARVARVMEAELQEQLRALTADETVEDVIVVTHHLPYAELVLRTGTLPWEFFAAFMGSKGLGEVIGQHSKVSAVVHGHAHRPTDRLIDGRQVLASPLGYPRERRHEDKSDFLRLHLSWLDRR